MSTIRKIKEAVCEKGFFKETLTEGFQMFVGWMLFLGTPLMLLLLFGLCFNSLWWLLALPVPFLWGGFWGVIINKIL